MVPGSRKRPRLDSSGSGDRLYTGCAATHRGENSRVVQATRLFGRLPEDSRPLCYHCHHRTTAPAIQVAFDPHHTIGAFCSAACAKSAVATLPAFVRDRVMLRLSGELWRSRRVRAEDVVPAPHWSRLEAYGGELTLAQFRDPATKSCGPPK